MDARELTKLIATGEGERLEFKESLSGTARESIRQRSAPLRTTFPVVKSQGAYWWESATTGRLRA